MAGRPIQTRATEIFFALMFLIVALQTRAQTDTNSLAADLPLIPENAKLVKESMLWSHTLTLRTFSGFKDNVLLSPADMQGSAVIGGGLDYSLSRLPLDGWGVDVLVSGDDERYLQKVPSDGADFWFADITGKRFLGDNWQLGFDANENYLDEVDFVDTAFGPSAVEIQGKILKLKPFIRRNLGTNWWVELDFPAAREILDAPLDNVWKYGPQLQAGFNDDRKREFSLSYEIQKFDHDDWLAVAADGAPILGRSLAIVEQKAEARWLQFWDAKNQWSTETKFTFTDDTDNGGSFFNFHQYSLSERARFQNKTWQATAAIRASYQDFPVQRTELLTGPTLNQILLRLSLHLDRRLNRWLKLYVEYNYDRALSNLPQIEYRANEIMVGAIWEF